MFEMLLVLFMDRKSTVMLLSYEGHPKKIGGVFQWGHWGRFRMGSGFWCAQCHHLPTLRDHYRTTQQSLEPQSLTLTVPVPDVSDTL